ncbi:MAG: hypothetical protein J4F28_09655 [Nitrosopumilaceae archaeon]|nr:hypothetical protein [Nitrosopumilaceae archaeon]
MLRYMMRDALHDIMHGMLHGMNRDGVKIVLDRTDDYVCGACGLILVGDLLEVAGHVHDMHDRLSFVLLEEGASEPGDCSGGGEYE